MIEDLYSVTQLAELMPGVTRFSVLGWIRRRAENGLAASGALIRVEGRWYVHRAAPTGAAVERP